MAQRIAGTALAAILLAVTFSGCIALGEENHTVTIPPLRNGATAEYEGYPEVTGPVQFRIQASHANPAVDGSSHDCIKGFYTFKNGTEQTVCLSYTTYEPIKGSFEYPTDNPYGSPERGAAHIFRPMSIFTNELLYLAFQATGRAWAEGDTMKSSWFGVPLTYTAVEAGKEEVIIEITLQIYTEVGEITPYYGGWSTENIRFALSNHHPFPLWFGSQTDTTGYSYKFHETAHLNWGIAGEGDPLEGESFNWTAHQERLVPYVMGWPPDGDPSGCAGRIGPERFVNLVLEYEPEIGKRLQEGTLINYFARKPRENSPLEFRTITESEGWWAFPDGTKQAYRVTIQNSTVYGDEVIIMENPEEPKDHKYNLDRFPIRGLPYCEAAKVLDTMRPGRSGINYAWPYTDGAPPEGATVYDLETRWGDHSGPFMSLSGNEKQGATIIKLQTGFI